MNRPFDDFAVARADLHRIGRLFVEQQRLGGLDPSRVRRRRVERYAAEDLAGITSCCVDTGEGKGRC